MTHFKIICLRYKMCLPLNYCLLKLFSIVYLHQLGDGGLCVGLGRELYFDFCACFYIIYFV